MELDRRDRQRERGDCRRSNQRWITGGQRTGARVAAIRVPQVEWRSAGPVRPPAEGRGASQSSSAQGETLDFYQGRVLRVDLARMAAVVEPLDRKSVV